MSAAAQASPETLTVALWAANLEPPAASLAAWIAAVEARLAEVQAGGASLLVLPELACVQWLGFAPAGLTLDRQVPWLAAVAQEAVAALRPLPARYGVALLAGSMPFALEAGQGHANRAWLLLPDGRAFFQDKLYLTPSEQNPHGWRFTPGRQINVVVWNGLRLGIAVCLDVEATALWARLAALDLDLILVPAKTDLMAGYYRVFGCARARAVELQTVVCAVGAVGTAFGQPLTDTVVGGAAAFIPCEARLGHSGVAAALEPQGALGGASPLLYAPHLPVGLCRRIRHGEAEAEVWPGSWPAHQVIADPATPVP